jgi:hypothetical protein
MQFAMLSRSSLTLFANRQFRLSLKLWKTFQLEYKESEFQISCQKHNLKPILTDYIYPISYKIAKKANPVKWIFPY